MTTFADRINPELKKQILEERAEQLIVEGYQNELARDQFTAIGDQEQAAQHEANLTVIVDALTVVEEQIGTLD
jgi:hypothetical protein